MKPNNPVGRLVTANSLDSGKYRLKQSSHTDSEETEVRKRKQMRAEFLRSNSEDRVTVSSEGRGERRTLWCPGLRSEK